MDERLPLTLRTTGLLCLVSGVLGAASGILLIVVTPAVPESRFSFPLATRAFIAIQVWFAVQHVGLLAGQWGLRASGAAGTGRLVRWGHWTGLVGMSLLTATEVLAIAAASDPYPSSVTDVLDVLYGISSVSVGLGMTVVGVAVLQVGRWRAWHRWVPLAIGIWVFVPMTPAIMAGFVSARLSITMWMLLYAALGWVLLAAGRSALTAGAPARAVATSRTR